MRPGGKLARICSYALDRVRRIAEGLGEVEVLAAADGAQRARDEHHRDGRGDRHGPPLHEARRTRPDAGARRADGGPSRPEDAACRARASRAGSSVSPASTVTAIPSASTGPISRVALKSARPSSSITPATIAPADRIAGAVRSAACVIAAAGGSPRSSSLAEARHEQQAVVGAGPEDQHDHDRRRLAADRGRAGFDEPEDGPGRDEVGDRDDDERDGRGDRRAVDGEQDHEDQQRRDRQQRAVDALDGERAVGVEAARPADVDPLARPRPRRPRRSPGSRSRRRPRWWCRPRRSARW